MVAGQSFWKDKRVLITGHTGFKGSWLCLILHRLGASVHGFALDPPTTPSLFVEAKINELVSSTICDIRDFNGLMNTFKQFEPEIVLHLAAQPLVRESYKFPVDTYSTNVMGTVHLLEACRQTESVRAIVNVTTDKCYENREWYWGYRENEPMGGYDPYSNSKGCSELVTAAYRNSYFNVKEYKNHGVALATARAGNVIGGGDWAGDRLIPDFIRAISTGKEVSIRSPYAIRPWQHVLEPLTGYISLAEQLFTGNGRFSEAWNFGPDDSDVKNVEWVINTICELWGNGASYKVDTNPQPHEASFLKLDCSKAKAELGWFPKWNLELALKSIVDWNKAWLGKQDIRKVTLEQINRYYSRSVD